MGTPANLWPVVAADAIMENSDHDFWLFLYGYLLEKSHQWKPDDISYPSKLTLLILIFCVPCLDTMKIEAHLAVGQFEMAGKLGFSFIQ